MDATKPIEPGSGRNSARRHAARLLAWYARSARQLPWRARPGVQPDPYHVWLSEVMLQQTTVATVGPYFQRFRARWPDVESLADASLDDVLVEWQGLGYYSRARNLHAAARHVAGPLGGRFPENAEALARLPGIGPYTAAAIAAIAFGQPAVVVDGNVERVIARLFAVEEPLPDAKGRLRELAADLSPRRASGRPGDYAQAMMDLGATVCRPRNPACDSCPLASGCLARGSGDPAAWPRRRKRSLRPVRQGIAWFAVNEVGSVLLRRRPETGLLGGMMEVPSTAWEARMPGLEEAPVAADWVLADRRVMHVFTHFRLELAVACARLPQEASSGRDAFGDGAIWVPPGRFGDYALPTVMKKVCALGLDFTGPG